MKLNQTQNSHERAALDPQALFSFYIQNVWFEMYVQCLVSCEILEKKKLSILSLLFFNLEI